MENTLQKKETIGQIPAHVIQGTDAISRKTNNDSTILEEDEKKYIRASGNVENHATSN